MKKAGFSLLSTLVSIFLGSLLMSTMLVMYNNIGRTARFVKRVSFSDTRRFVMIDQMQQDFAGMTMMWSGSSEEDKEKEVVAQAEEAFLENKIFYSKNKGDRFDYLTFITTNSLLSYADVKPHFIRVVYRLQASEGEKVGFQLMRKELTEVSDKMSEEDLKGGVFSEVAGEIANMSMNYYYFNKQNEEAVKAQAMDTGTGYPVNSLSEWNSESEELESKAAQLYPIATEVTVSFGGEEPVQFRLDVPATISVVPTIPQSKTSSQSQESATATSEQPQEVESEA